MPRVGEISLAHHGVLFLDELTLFSRSVLEGLRQPLEDGTVQIGRARGTLTYPARFMLVAAMNPCPCGFRDTGDGRCICTPYQQQQYDARISGPLLDRFDLHIELPALPERRLRERGLAESSEHSRGRVLAARERQERRQQEGALAAPVPNGQLGPRGIREYCVLDGAGERLLREATRKLGLSARAYHRVLRLARTIADLAGQDNIRAAHVAEAIQYRTLDRAPVRAARRAG